MKLIYLSVRLALVTLTVIMCSACKNVTQTETLPTQVPVVTDVFAEQDDFGDGYIARVPVEKVNALSSEEIVRMLIAEWLQHYKSQSQQPNAAVLDYTIGDITPLDNTLYPGYEIVVNVSFSIIPVQTPNQWASFPGDLIDSDDTWWNVSAPFGVFRDGDHYRLRLLFGWGV